MGGTDHTVSRGSGNLIVHVIVASQWHWTKGRIVMSNSQMFIGIGVVCLVFALFSFLAAYDMKQEPYYSCLTEELLIRDCNVYRY